MESLDHGLAKEIICSPKKTKKKLAWNVFTQADICNRKFPLCHIFKDALCKMFKNALCNSSKLLYVKCSKLLYVNLYRGSVCPKHNILLHTNPKGKRAWGAIGTRNASLSKSLGRRYGLKKLYCFNEKNDPFGYRFFKKKKSELK